jgi:glycosyltransferase involved in cell wall biosynthesis
MSEFVAAPLVSFGIPAYNRPVLLREALASIRDQTLSVPYEVIVCDDFGLEETKAVVAEFPSSHFRYVRNETTLGAVANWNRCLASARAPWVMVLHEDDALYPGYLELAVPRMADGVAAIATKTVQGETQPVRPPVPPLPPVWNYPPRYFMKSAMTPFPGVLVRRELALSLGGFDLAWGPLADYDFWYRLACAGRVEVIRAVGAFYRVSPGQWTERAWARMLRQGHLMRLRIAREQFGQAPRWGRWLARYFTLRNARSYAKRFPERPVTLERALRFRRIAFSSLPSGWIWQIIKRTS